MMYAYNYDSSNGSINAHYYVSFRSGDLVSNGGEIQVYIITTVIDRLYNATILGDPVKEDDMKTMMENDAGVGSESHLTLVVSLPYCILERLVDC